MTDQAEHQSMPSHPITATRPDDPQDIVPCFDCGADTRRKWGEHTFTYGAGPDAAELTVTLPIHVCPSCGFECIDGKGEALKHEAVCRHLGVLSPREISRIRETHGMTRAAFARVTGLGEATLNRWEKGILIQNTANDRYLRLVAAGNNIQKLQRLTTEPKAPLKPVETVPESVPGCFPHIDDSDECRRRQADFDLRPQFSPVPA